jgi:hypothetical protein
MAQRAASDPAESGNRKGEKDRTQNYVSINRNLIS